MSADYQNFPRIIRTEPKINKSSNNPALQDYQNRFIPIRFNCMILFYPVLSIIWPLNMIWPNDFIQKFTALKKLMCVRLLIVLVSIILCLHKKRKSVFSCVFLQAKCTQQPILAFCLKFAEEFLAKRQCCTEISVSVSVTPGFLGFFSSRSRSRSRSRVFDSRKNRDFFTLDKIDLFSVDSIQNAIKQLTIFKSQIFEQRQE